MKKSSRETIFAGLEIGGSKLQLVAGDGQGRILERRRLKVAAEKGGAEIRAQIEASLAEMTRRHRPRAMGVGFGGPVDWRTGKVWRSHQVEGWSGFELGSWLSELTGLPARVDNDANVAALGEALFGAGRGRDPFFYVTLGSGVGGGLVIEGRIYHGICPGESEIGHLRLNRRGTLVESRCSGWAVDRRIRMAARRRKNGALARLAARHPGAEAACLPQALAAGDPDARRILEETAEDLAFALSHVAHLFHPAAMVLGGGLSLIGQPLRRAVAQRLPGFLMEVFQPGPQILLSELREDAVPMGALALAASAGAPAR